jgi:hypothetical protein
MAGLEGFEYCPFCPFGALIPEGDTESLFYCQREGCKKVSCRKCKKKDHTSELCESMVEDAAHNVAEAMTNGLIRTFHK